MKVCPNCGGATFSPGEIHGYSGPRCHCNRPMQAAIDQLYRGHSDPPINQGCLPVQPLTEQRIREIIREEFALHEKVKHAPEHNTSVGGLLAGSGTMTGQPKSYWLNDLLFKNPPLAFGVLNKRGELAYVLIVGQDELDVLLTIDKARIVPLYGKPLYDVTGETK